MTGGWIAETPALAALDPAAARQLAALDPVSLPRGHVLFRPGDAARGFVIVLSGRVEVYLTGAGGREILLYAVEPGSSCVQTTLGLLGGTDYSGEALAATDLSAVLVPRGLFLALMAASEPFRNYVFAAFARRMQDMMQVLERVAFQRIESRLAQALLDLAVSDSVAATHQELATRIGSAREVVSRRLDALSRAGLVATERGAVLLRDRSGLTRLAAVPD